MRHPLRHPSTICELEVLPLCPPQRLLAHPAPPHLLVSHPQFRNDKYKKTFYMKFCPLSEASHFYIVNYDGQVSIVKKDSKQFTLSDTEARRYVCFVNRYMTYIVDEEEVVRLFIYNFEERLRSITEANH